MKNKITLKIAEAAAKSAPRFTEDADLLISQIVRDLNLESEAELAFCKQMVNDSIKLCKQGKGSDLKKNFIK
tara:strand:+ start:285 stop:500 length:216 start_codon:yes stop_codon:yes gene_type:complete